MKAFADPASQRVDRMGATPLEAPVKKSEKIEVRVAPEEKEQLTKRAEAEGRPVSEVVRRGMTGEGMLGEETGPASQSPLQRLGAMVLSFAAGAALTVALSAAHPKQVLVEGWDGSFQLSALGKPPVRADFRVLAYENSKAEIVLDRAEGGFYRVTSSSTPLPDGRVKLTFSVCIDEGQECRVVASPEVTTVPREEIQLSWLSAEEAVIGFALRPLPAD